MTEDSFSCLHCKSDDLENNEVVILKCQHIYCWKCIGEYVDCNLSVKMKCPFENCLVNLNDNVIRKALPNHRINDYEMLSLTSIKSTQTSCFKCLLPNCDAIIFFDKKDIQFECLKCTLFNCISCNDTHPFYSCKDYKVLKKSKDPANVASIQSMKKEEFERASVVLRNKIRQQMLNNSILLEQFDVIPNNKTFDCSICMKVIAKEIGIQLRNCSHEFCRDCLHNGIINSATIPVLCLDSSCHAEIQDREIRGILNVEELNVFNDRSLSLAKSKLINIFHCKKPDCTYFGLLDGFQQKQFECPVCHSNNCITCNAIHKKNEACKDYEKKENNADKLTRKYIENKIKEQKWMKCPTCGCIINKNGGCNWIKCPQCKLELCWVLKIPRWGPKGEGDISGGCRCGVDGKLCHPECLVGCIPEKS